MKINVDYMTMKSGKEGQEIRVKGQQDQHDEGNPIVVYRVRDGPEDRKTMGAHVVPSKGG